MAVAMPGLVKPMVGDLFDSRAQTLVNTVNCVGVMGKGIALGFRQRFPEMYNEYVGKCQRGEVHLGRPYLWTPVIPPWVLNFPTKDHWRSTARLDAIVEGLEYLAEHYKEWGITSLAVPPLGCGEGGLEWRLVGPTLYRHLQHLDIPVELYAPWDVAPEELSRGFLEEPPSAAKPARLSPAAVAVAVVVSRLAHQPYGPPAGRIVVQKIAYFLAEAGVPAGWVHVQGSFGPYSADARATGTKLISNGVLVERRIGQTIAAAPGPRLDDARNLYAAELATWTESIDRVVDLLMRLRTTRKIEVAATVHFAVKMIARQTGTGPSEIDVLRYVRQWKQRRKPPLSDQEIALAIRALNALGWIRLEPSEELPLPA
jgi:O-acetyl-ADP-ribose deacetylase (regulator of RNase III)